jgi:hypothetical protein
MIKIKKGQKVMSVPSASYDNFYKNAGWKKVEQEAETVCTDNDVDLDEVNEDLGPVLEEEEEEVIDDEWANYEDEEVEKPLSEMTDAELKEKAASLGIDTKGLSAKQIRAKIKNHPA